MESIPHTGLKNAGMKPELHGSITAKYTDGHLFCRAGFLKRRSGATEKADQLNNADLFIDLR